MLLDSLPKLAYQMHNLESEKTYLQDSGLEYCRFQVKAIA